MQQWAATNPLASALASGVFVALVVALTAPFWFAMVLAVLTALAMFLLWRKRGPLGRRYGSDT